MKLAALLVVFLQVSQPAIQPPRPAEKASIEGVVLRSGSGDPLPRTELRLTRVLSEEPQGNFLFGGDVEGQGLPTVVTESDGKFLLKDLEPGQYRLTAFRNGYAEQSYGRKGSSGPGTIINLIAGEKLANVVFRLVPAGVITGRVRDASGEPVSGFDVTLLKAVYNGERQYLSHEDSARTDDRGEYRFFWIPSGRYYVRVSRPRQTGSVSRRIVADSTTPAAYYPGVLDASSAFVIDLTAGAEISGIDLVLPRASGNRIRGRIVDASTGKPPASASVSVSPKKEQMFENGFEEADETRYNSMTGEFEIRNVLPGSYWLAAIAQPKFDAPLSPEQLADVRTGADIFTSMFLSGASAQTSIDMNGADREDIVLTLTKGTTVPVRLGVEGAEWASLKEAGDIRVSLAPEISKFQYRQGGRPSAEGIARIENVSAGQYRVTVEHPPAANLYVKDILYGRSNALATPIEITDQLPSAISVLLSTRGGQVEGRLTDALSQPVSGVEVALIPDERERSPLFKTAVTDREGRFTFGAVAPGGYKVFSWEAMEGREYYNKQVLSMYESQGRSVRVQESSKERVDLKIIPAPQQ